MGSIAGCENITCKFEDKSEIILDGFKVILVITGKGVIIPEPILY